VSHDMDSVFVVGRFMANPTPAVLPGGHISRNVSLSNSEP
jgi:hypothetical protein